MRTRASLARDCAGCNSVAVAESTGRSWRRRSLTVLAAVVALIATGAVRWMLRSKPDKQTGGDALNI